MEKYVFDLVAFLVGCGLVGLVGLLVNGLKNEICDMKEMLKGMVSEPLCKERRENMEKDINNIGTIMRNLQ
jgi:hypothetical protein